MSTRATMCEAPAWRCHPVRTAVEPSCVARLTSSTPASCCSNSATASRHPRRQHSVNTVPNADDSSHA